MPAAMRVYVQLLLLLYYVLDTRSVCGVCTLFTLYCIICTMYLLYRIVQAFRAVFNTVCLENVETICLRFLYSQSQMNINRNLTLFIH